MFDDIEFDSLCLTERSVARFLIKYQIGDSVPYRVIYQVYMSSPEWRERKATYFSIHLKQCQSCGSTEGIQLHHKSYAHFTQEPDEDLAAVCETCHQWIHLLHRSSPLNLIDATDAVIAAGRKQVPPDPDRWKRPTPGKQGTPMDRHFAARRASQSYKTAPTRRGSWVRDSAKKLRAVEQFRRQQMGDA